MSHISSLWSNTTNIRNICILAHVDHGKTTLTDYLLASNSIISQRQAGHARYMDSRSDEQERGITMKSSAVALKYIDTDNDNNNTTTNNGTSTHNKASNEYIVHVIDSPGHIDFSSEVSHAVRLCDGACVLVDVLEGIQVQSIAVLEQCWSEKLIPILCLTKLDRLLVEVRMNTNDAYVHIRKLLESINAITSTFITRDAMKQHVQVLLNKQRRTSTAIVDDTDDGDQYVDYDEGNRFEFLPEKGNVVFCSAVDGWAFNIPMFAQLFSVKLGVSESSLQRVLYGDYYYHSKDKKVSTRPNKQNKVMFVQLILDNIWSIYDTINMNDQEKIDTIVSKLNINVPARELQSNDRKLKLQSILSRWLPLSPCVLHTVIQHIPNPIKAQQNRMSDMWPYVTGNGGSGIVRDTLQCNAGSDHVVLYISKMIDIGSKTAVKQPVTSNIVRKAYVRGGNIGGTNESTAIIDTPVVSNSVISDAIDTSNIDDADDGSSTLIAFARVYCGTLKSDSDQVLHIIGPKFNISNSIDKERALGHISTVPMNSLQLYMLMATDTHLVDSIPAGNVCGIGGLHHHVLKNATVSTDIIPSFTSMKYQTQPIVRVAIEPVHGNEMKKLNQGLKLLNLADSNVSIGIQETGESVIIAAGELHLERCIRDLRDRYAPGVQLRVSAPIVPYRETIVNVVLSENQDKQVNKKQQYSRRKQNDNDDELYYNNIREDSTPLDTVTDTTPNRVCTITLQAIPLSDTIIELLERSQHLIKKLHELQQHAIKRKQRPHLHTADNNTNSIEQQAQQLQLNDDDDSNSVVSHSTAASTDQHNHTNHTNTVGTDVQQFIDELRAEFKSHSLTSVPADDIVDRIWCFGSKKIGTNILLNNVSDLYRGTSIVHNINDLGHAELSDRQQQFLTIQNGIVNGFQLSTLSGPLCDEPVSGVMYIIQSIELNWNDAISSSTTSGQVLSVVKELCRSALPLHSQRLIEPIYQVDLQCTADQLGALYNVLSKRRGKIISDELLEGTSLFMVTAYLPVTESFGFANDIRTKTGGQANPQLIFHHWQLIEIDPYWIPTTEDELEEYGGIGLTEQERINTNLARRLVDTVRRRKGLPTRDKVVESGSKQRTLNRKK